MRTALFLDQVQTLIHAQQIKLNEELYKRALCKWLSTKKYYLTWISPRDEFLIRQAVHKLSADKQTVAIKQLINFINENPNLDPTKVPEACINILDRLQAYEMVRQESLRRASTFRESLRRFSNACNNKVTPTFLHLPANNNQRKSVTFNENLEIYSISQH